MQRLLSLLLGLLLTFSPSMVSAQSNITPTNNDRDVQTLEDYISTSAENLSDEVIFGNVASLAGSTCSLYALGEDVVNFFYDGNWSPLDSLLSITTLFRSQSWRDLIWALEDEKEKVLDQLVALKKQRCLLTFSQARPAARSFFGSAEDDEVLQRISTRLQALELEITALEARRNYFHLQRSRLLRDRSPVFFQLRMNGQNSFVLDRIATDKVFFFLGGFTSFEVNYEELANESADFVMRTYTDLEGLGESLKDSCYAVSNLFDELYQHFAYTLTAGGEYKNFGDFVEQNRSAIQEEYFSICREQQERLLPINTLSSAEEQVQTLRLVLQQNLKIYDQVLNIANDEILTLVRIPSAERSDIQQEDLGQLIQNRAWIKGLRDYTALVIQKVAVDPATDLTVLSERLSGLLEALLGLQEDGDGGLSSRLSLAERFEKSSERTLQNLCSRIEDLYRASNRDPATIPIIGHANGRTYCRPNPKCEGVNLFNFAGGSEGRRKLAECSGFLFDEEDLSPDPATLRSIQETSEDLSTILQQSAEESLLESREFYFRDLRSRYRERFQASEYSTASLERVLKDVSKDLYDPELQPEVYDPNAQKDGYHSTHYGLLRKIYQDFWTFQSRVNESCPAPENPVE